MARGWESKAVEEQISAREAEFQESGKKKTLNTLTPLEYEIHAKRQGILLVRTRTLNELNSTRDEQYRALLERTIADLDARLAKLGGAV